VISSLGVVPKSTYSDFNNLINLKGTKKINTNIDLKRMSIAAIKGSHAIFANASEEYMAHNGVKQADLVLIFNEQDMIEENLNCLMDEMNTEVIVQRTEIYKYRFPTDDDRIYDGKIVRENEDQLIISRQENDKLLIIEPISDYDEETLNNGEGFFTVEVNEKGDEQIYNNAKDG
jgi:alpha-glucosidase (family GH31 glycosyl hydrolase)